MAILSRIRRRKFGEILLNQGIVSNEQLNEALEMQRGSGGLLGEILLTKGAITEMDVARALCIQYQLPFLRATQCDVRKEIAEKFSTEFFYRHRLIPFDKIGHLVLVICADIPNDPVVDEISNKVGGDVALFIDTASDVEAALSRLRPMSDDAREQLLNGSQRVTVKAAVATATQGSPEEEADPGSSWEAIFDEAEKNLRSEPDME